MPSVGKHQESEMAPMNPSLLFNGPVELGLRALIILVESYPRPLDIQRLVTLDYLVIHSGDIDDGPKSIHPASPLRAGEFSIRRELIENGLNLFSIKGLVSKIADSTGFSYIASDNASVFLDALKSEYAEVIRDRAAWALEKAGALTDSEVALLIEETIGKWKAEFVIEEVEDSL